MSTSVIFIKPAVNGHPDEVSAVSYCPWIDVFEVIRVVVNNFDLVLFSFYDKTFAQDVSMRPEIL